MFRAVIVVLACTLVLFSSVTSANICEGYNKTECIKHKDDCVACRAFDKLDLCFEPQIAELLPKGSFKCELPSALTALHLGDSACDPLDKSQCESTASCVWCDSVAVPSFCASQDDAKRLPPGAFQCHFPSAISR